MMRDFALRRQPGRCELYGRELETLHGVDHVDFTAGKWGWINDDFAERFRWEADAIAAAIFGIVERTVGSNHECVAR